MDFEKCPYGENTLRKGAIRVSAYIFDSVEWLENPEHGRFGIKWKTRQHLFGSTLSTVRNALRCDVCNTVIFDPRDPEKIVSELVDESGPWNTLFPPKLKQHPKESKDLL